VLEQNGVVLITADHGNSEQMIDYETGDLSRTYNKSCSSHCHWPWRCQAQRRRLADLAPTMLDILGFEKPKEMTGESLIVK